jgi:hypothetical protein
VHVTDRHTLSLSRGQTKSSSVTLVSLRSTAALAAQVALSPFEKSLTMNAALGQSLKAKSLSCSATNLKDTVDFNII